MTPDAGQIELNFTVDAARHADKELRSLLGWLRRDLRDREVNLKSPLGVDDQLGALAEVLSVLVPGGAGAALATSLGAWLTSRRSEITITARRADGAAIRIERKGG